MMLQFLNCSIDAPDIYSKIFEYNEQESILELILEKVLGHEDAISEYQCEDAEHNNLNKKKVNFDYFTLPDFELKNQIESSLISMGNNFYKERIKVNNNFKIHLPPPKLI